MRASQNSGPTTKRCSENNSRDVYKRQILDKVPAQTLAMANPDALETVEQLLTEEEMAMGVAKGNDDLLEVVNSVLQKAMDDGTVESLTDKHLKICAEG